MQRVLVMGSSGSGKSTFARKLSGITGLPFVSLDALFWKLGWVESGKAEFRERLTEVALQPRLIMDGNFPSHLRADQALICFCDRTQAEDYLRQVEFKQNRPSIH
jgi:adenylate kinase family enzyme